MQTLVIGCGNLLRGDDAAGPEVARRLLLRGLPADTHCLDAGTAGIDVAFQMRGVPHVILVDACRSESAPGTIFELSGCDVEQSPSPSGINLHAFRWDHALALGRFLLGDDYPAKVTVFLIEGGSFEPGEPLSPPVDRAIDGVCTRILQVLEPVPAGANAPGRLAVESDPWPAAGWHAGPREEDVAAGNVVAVSSGDARGIVVRSKAGLRAFRNNCAHAGLPLDSSTVDPFEGTLTCRWHAFRFDSDSGRCLSAPMCMLEAWDVRVVEGVIWVRPPIVPRAAPEPGVRRVAPE